MNELDVKKAMLKKLKSVLMSEDDMGLGDALKKGTPGKMQKVMVASDSPEGLKHGLSKAQEIMQKHQEMMGHDEPEECDDDEDVESDEEKKREEDDKLHDGGMHPHPVGELQKGGLSDSADYSDEDDEVEREEEGDMRTEGGIPDHKTNVDEEKHHLKHKISRLEKLLKK